MNPDVLAATLDPASFAGYASRGSWQRVAHLDHLNSMLVEMVSGGPDRVSVAMPPRHGKSVLCSWYFPAWYLIRHPERRVMLVSYEADFAASWGRRVRDTLIEHGQPFGVQVSPDSKAASRFDLTAGGGMVTAGIGGPITGKGGDLIIIDDPVKNYEEAVSPLVSQRNWDWYQTTLRTRLEPGAVVLVVMTRWSEIDLAGKLTESDERWHDLRLPALAEDNDPLGRKVGEALWPNRFDETELDRTRTALSPSHWSALYQGRPTPLDGDVFKREWFTSWWYDDGVITTDAGPAQGGVKVFITVDLAISTQQTADPTVMAVWGIDNARRLYLLALERKRIPAPSQARLIERLNREWSPYTILVEDVAYQRAFIQHAAAKGLPVKGVKPDGNKLARSVAASDMMQRGHIAFPMAAPWLETLYGELLAFPNGRHDDIVDVISYAAQHSQTRRQRVSLKGWTLDPALTKPRGI